MIVRAIFEHGSFTSADTVAVWLTLAFLSTGLLAVTATRLLQNGLYALDDARTPARLGVIGVVLSAVIGVVLMFPLDRLVVGADGIEGWGDIGLRAAAGRRPGRHARGSPTSASWAWPSAPPSPTGSSTGCSPGRWPGGWGAPTWPGGGWGRSPWAARRPPRWRGWRSWCSAGCPRSWRGAGGGAGGPGLRGDHLPPGGPEARATVARLQGLATRVRR